MKRFALSPTANNAIATVVVAAAIVPLILRSHSSSYKNTEQRIIAAINQGMVKNVYGGVGGYLAPEITRQKLWVKADFLFWKADEDGLEYGTKMTARPFNGTTAQVETTLLDMHFNWDPGFRIGAGYQFNHFDNWSLGLNWTHLNSHAHGNSKAAGTETQVENVDTIISPWVNLLFELRAGSARAKAKWDLDYNTIDLDLGRSFFVSQRLSLSPHVGLRGAMIDQDYHVKYRSVFLLAEAAPLFQRYVNFKAKNDFGGIGLRSGSGLTWHFTKNWNLFAQLSASVLYGRFNVKMTNENDQGLGLGAVPPSPIDFETKEHFWRTRFNFEEAIGLGWQTSFKDDRYRFSIKAAYEMTQWLSQNELYYSLYFRGTDTISSVPIRNGGNLGFQGLTAGMQFDF